MEKSPRSDYLKSTRVAYWNSDYMEFLIEKVWRIESKVDVVDFGCGLGYLAELMLPLLPEGSSYTGIDTDEALLCEARSLFEGKGLNVRFETADAQSYGGGKFDVAVCQTVMQHVGDPDAMLSCMISAVKPNGLVACFEISRNAADAAMHIDGLDSAKLNMLGIEQKLRDGIYKEKHLDHEIGAKMPVYMERAGLTNVSVRMNDFVNFVSPLDALHEVKLNALRAGDYEKPLSEERQSRMISFLESRGLTHEEAERETKGVDTITRHIADNFDTLYAVESKCMFISYGYRII